MLECYRFDPFDGDASFGREALSGLDERWSGHGCTVEPELKIEIRESPDHYIVTAEMPGVGVEALNLSIDGTIVCISGEVQPMANETPCLRTVRNERYFGRVARSFTLDREIEHVPLSVQVRDGIVTLLLVKTGAGRADAP